jgi:hypothetical protein
MAMRTKATNDADSEAMAKWCRTVLRFLADRGHLNEPMRVQLEGIVSDCATRRDVRGLRQVQRDFREMTRALSGDDRGRLDGLLSGFSGPTTSQERGEIAAILARGEVENEDEYRLLMGRVDEIFQDPSKNDELEAINNLLARSKYQ